MTRWDQSPEILSLADELGVSGAAPVNGILDYCKRRIDGWVAEADGVSNIDALEALVTQKLQMVFEEIRADDDWDRLKEVYARGKKEFVFGAIRTKFDDDHNLTYGALVERRYAGPSDLDRFVAVIDCRGSKLARRFFTRWHEIAHRLTTHTDLHEPVYRSEHDPIERMMDEIAGHVGFYEPIFNRALILAAEVQSLFSFRTAESVIRSDFPAASFQSTLVACTRRLPTPVVYIEAKLDHKKEVKRKMATPRLFGEDLPGELRAVKVIPNTAAYDAGFMIPANMRVPAESVIFRLFESEIHASDNAMEDLSQWESKGRQLQQRAVVVEGRRVADRVIAIVQPVQ